MPHDDEIRNHCRVYVGNLPPDVREKDVEDLFKKYGKITMIDLKMKRGPPFAFLEYDNERDANEAVKYRDGYDYDGYRLRVERPRGLPRTAANNYTRGPPMRRSYSGGGDRGGDRGGGDRGGGRDGGGRGAPGRGRYRISVTGLPPTGSWQDLKDHFREAGEVAFTDVRKDGSGVVEFVRYEDMKYALKKLDDTKFKSHQGETAYIRVCEEGERPPTSSSSRKRSRSRSKSRSRSRSASPPRRSRASPTYSPVRNKRSASGSRSSSPRSRSRS